jgi:hypothetical protein
MTIAVKCTKILSIVTVQTYLNEKDMSHCNLKIHVCLKEIQHGDLPDCQHSSDATKRVS